MKKCMRCAKQATLYITELKSGKSISLQLCEECAQEYLNTVEVGAIPEDFGNDLASESEESSLSDVDSEDFESKKEDTSKACPHCGITFKQFRTQGRLGCPKDYEVFHNELIPLLESIHGEIQHVGKFPPRVSDQSRRQFELVRLKSELKIAIEDENYEDAARLRDQIQEIEKNGESA